MRIRIKLSFIVILLSLFVNSVYAIHYLQWSTSVDAWEIRWWGVTKYTTQWSNAISMWHNYWPIDILPDTASTYEDMTVKDVYRSDVTWSWRMTPSAGADSLELNTWFLDWLSYAGSFTSSNKQHTIWHELWHALGLAHHNISLNVLQSWKQTAITLWIQDKYDYDYLW